MGLWRLSELEILEDRPPPQSHPAGVTQAPKTACIVIAHSRRLFLQLAAGRVTSLLLPCEASVLSSWADSRHLGCPGTFLRGATRCVVACVFAGRVQFFAASRHLEAELFGNTTRHDRSEHIREEGNPPTAQPGRTRPAVATSSPNATNIFTRTCSLIIRDADQWVAF